MEKIFLRGLISLYRLCPHWGKKLIYTILVRIDGGEFWSISLRQIYSRYYDIEIGLGSYGCFDIQRIPRGTKIGNYCSFSKEVWIFNGNHPSNFISTHPVFYNPNLGYVREERITRQKLSIGHDVWIGYGAIILPNVSSIATGAIIGAGSVVTKNVEPFQIVAGNPAKEIRKRFSPDRCKQILESDWFLKSPSELFTSIDFADKPESFLEHMMEVKQ